MKKGIVNGSLIILKEKYKKEVEEQVGFISTDTKTRPVMLSFEDSKRTGIKYAVPLTKKEHLSKEKIEDIERMLKEPNGMHFHYYEPVKILGKDYYAKVRDVKPITNEYIEREFTNYNIPTIVKNSNTLKNIETKIIRVLAMSERKPEQFEQKPSETRLLLECNKLKSDNK